ncbi:MAG: hypothetical protein AAFN11_09160, partial [Chloroflexota bacterium]
DTFITTQAPRTATAPIWQWMLISVLILLPIDIAIRRIIITRRDLRRFSMWVRGVDPNAAPEQRISSLMAARDRARARTGAGERDGSAITALRRTKERRAGESDTPANSTDVFSPDTPTAPQPRRPRPVDSPPSDSLGTVGNLLKRRRTDDEDDEN